MTTTSTLTNLRPVGGPDLQADRSRTVHRANTEPVSPAAYPADLALVVDLRREDEVARVPHPLRESTGYRQVPMFDPSVPESGAAAVALEDQYTDWTERHAAGIAAALRAVAGARGDVLVCCSAGKDRTGVIAALLARHWGASIATAAVDYAASAAGLVERFAAERAASEDPEATAVAQRCVPEIMQAVLERIEARWGSIDGYLRWLGLSEEEVAAL